MNRKTVILGSQWGDEGKGKIVDLLSDKFDVTVRYQGGSNAGHTVVVNGKKFILHLLPTGILHPEVTAVISQGVVLDLETLDRELKGLKERGIDFEGRLLISDRAHLVLPYHKVLDRVFEKKSSIGTTLRGVGPAYMFKYGRKGIRVCDLEDEVRFRELLKDNLNFVRALCSEVFGEEIHLDEEEIFTETMRVYEKIRGMVVDTAKFLRETDKSLLFEGAQGTMLDVDAGTYPYVTSSNSSALGLPSGTGLSPKFFSDAYFVGIAKAYTTRVGEGPFPTELKGEEGKALREAGGEYGSTTGRPRRCGWLDMVALRYAVKTNGMEALIVTKLDVLDGFEELKVCVAYRLEGELITEFPASLSVLERCEPVYETLKGWKGSVKGAGSFHELPQEARDYIRFIEEFTGVPVIMLSVGPSRDEFLWIEERIRKSLSFS